MFSFRLENKGFRSGLLGTSTKLVMLLDIREGDSKVWPRHEIFNCLLM